MLVNLNLDYQNSNLMIQNILKTDFYTKYNGKIYIKSHPLFEFNQIFNLKNKNNGFNKQNFFFKKDNSWKEEVDEFANLVKSNGLVKVGNLDDVLNVMKQ